MSEELTAEEFLRIQKIEYIFTAKTNEGNRYDVCIGEVMEEYTKAKTGELALLGLQVSGQLIRANEKIKELQKEVEIWKEYKNTTDKKLVERLDYESERDEIILKLKAENEALKDCLRKLTKSGLKEKIEARIKAKELLNQTTT